MKSVSIVVALVTAVSSLLAGEEYTIGVPLLDHVFFDSANARIPQRFVRLTKDEAERFSLDSVSVQADFQAFRQILNIVGLRMLKNPNWTLTLRPFSYGEVADDTVPMIRARSIVEYLNHTWQIDTSRLTIDASNTGQTRYNPRVVNGNRKNWRVDLMPSDARLLAPVWLRVRANTDSTVLYTAVLLWDPDSDSVTTSIELLVAGLLEYRPNNSSSRFVIHGDDDARRFSHWYALSLKRANKIKDKVGIDSVYIDHDRSRHDACTHLVPEECIYKSAMYIEYWHNRP
jgi:hypothetical protein